MLVYWSMVLLPALLSFAEPRRRQNALGVVLLPLLFITLFLFLALRETGGDFTTYLLLYENLQGATLEAAMQSAEPIYGFLNWLSHQFDVGIYGVNTVCALIFLYALFRTARDERHPLFFVTLAVPYFVIVVGMGYTRQGVAAAQVLLSVVYLRKGSIMRAALAILVGAGFHYSAFAALALPILTSTRHHVGVMWLVSRSLLVAVLIVSTQSLLTDQLYAYTAHYIDSDRYQSRGAFLRSIVTAAASIAFFACSREFKRAYDDYAIWRPFAVLGLLCPLLSLYASTPVDRLGLYLIPFQLVIFARLPEILNGGRSFLRVRTLVLTSYLLYFYVWLHMGSYSAELWIPYRWIFS